MLKLIGVTRVLNHGAWSVRLTTKHAGEVVKRVDYPMPIVLNHGLIMVKLCQTYFVNPGDIEIPEYIEVQLPIHRSQLWL